MHQGISSIAHHGLTDDPPTEHYDYPIHNKPEDLICLQCRLPTDACDQPAGGRAKYRCPAKQIAVARKNGRM